MKQVPGIVKLSIVAILVLSIASCEKDYYYVTPPPHVPQQTSTLEAAFTTTSPATLSAAYWKTADYLRVSATNVNINRVYTDGWLNMTGTYTGLTGFNNGTDPGLIVKAAYDNDNLYILAEWQDPDVDASNASWLYNGPLDPRKADATNGWTSQRNSDRIAFAFDINAASSPAGAFSSVGCAASCHSNVGIPSMRPTSGQADIWNWSVALTNPMGYAEDMIARTDSFVPDGGQRIYYRNSNGTNSRSGPAYEWDGTSQTVALPSGQNSILDPAFYLLNKTPFTGDIARGDSIYHTLAPPGDCASCHGDKGEGGISTPLNYVSLNKSSRSALSQSMDIVPDMAPYWGTLNSADKEDIIAFLRGLSGVPGYYLSTPTASNADIKAVSNITPINIKNAMLLSTNQHTKYQVLFIRKLKTNNADDAQFDLSLKKTFKFGISIMDNDGINHIGSTVETLTFK